MGAHADSPGNAGKSRRGFLKASLAAGALGALQRGTALGAPNAAAQPRRPVLDEHDPRNIKLAHRVPSTGTSSCTGEPLSLSKFRAKIGHPSWHSRNPSS